MPMHHSKSRHLHQAQELLHHVKGTPLSLEEREKNAVELSSHMLQEAVKTQTPEEKKRQKQLANMMHDPKGKAFTTCMTDQCFRSKVPSRIANQLIYLLSSLGIPQYLGFFKRCQLQAFKLFGAWLAPLLTPLVAFMLRKETSSVISPGEPSSLSKHLALRRSEGVRMNINRLGEAILGEKEAKRRLQVYLDDLAGPDVDYISVKISTIYSQIHLLAWEETLDALAERLRKLYRAAMNHPIHKNG
ncbi:MAG: proline dehydrogenase, partial [Chlamydiae bacterium]|nr:proline dehydrogenase [Chlamydiota bacterium]